MSVLRAEIPASNPSCPGIAECPNVGGKMPDAASMGSVMRLIFRLVLVGGGA